MSDFKVGDKVFYSSWVGAKPDRTKAYEILGFFDICGEPCAKLDGKSGGVSLEVLTLKEEG